MNSLKSFEGTPVRRSGTIVQLLAQAGGQLPAVISNQRSPLVGVGASKNAAENREKQRTLLQIRSHPKLEFYVSSNVNSSIEKSYRCCRQLFYWCFHLPRLDQAKNWAKLITFRADIQDRKRSCSTLAEG